MRGVVRAVMGAVLAFVLSGCAGGQTRQELARLKSQVGLLDERVGQLERTNVSALPSQGLAEPTEEALVTPESPSSPTRRASAGKETPAKPSLKPTTREIQQALKNAGFYQGAVDGKMGAMTREAIKEFQRVHGLTDDGVVGKQTWAKLRAYADLSAGSDEANAAEVLK